MGNLEKLNNYEMGIEINANYDYDLSSIYFDESFEILRYSGYRESSILYFTDFGNNPKFNLDFNKLSKNDLLKYLQGYALSNKKDYLIDALFDKFYELKDFEILLELDNNHQKKTWLCR